MSEDSPFNEKRPSKAVLFDRAEKLVQAYDAWVNGDINGPSAAELGWVIYWLKSGYLDRDAQAHRNGYCDSDEEIEHEWSFEGEQGEPSPVERPDDFVRTCKLCSYEEVCDEGSWGPA